MAFTDAVQAAQRVMERFTPAINKGAAFLLILFLGFLGGKVLARLAKRGLHALGADAKARRAGLTWSVERRTALVLAGTAYVAAIVLALAYVGALRWTLIVLGTLVAASAVLSLLVGAWHNAPNAYARLRYGKRAPRGATVEKHGILNARIIKNGDVFLVPNRLL